MEPVVVGYFIREVVDLNAFYVVLLSLVNKKKIRVEKVGNDYEFSLLEKEVKLNKIDKYVLNSIFSEYESSIRMSDFKQLFTTESAKEGLGNILIDMESILIDEVAYLTEDNGDAKKSVYMKIGLGFLLFSILNFVLNGLVYGFEIASIMPGLTVGFLITTSLSFHLVFLTMGAIKKNREGADQYRKWKAYRAFLKQRMNSEKRVVEDIILWDHHLTYALALGVAGKVLDELDWLNGDVVEVSNGVVKIVHTE